MEFIFVENLLDENTEVKLKIKADSKEPA